LKYNILKTIKFYIKHKRTQVIFIMDINLLNYGVEKLNTYFAKPIYNSGLRFDSTNNLAHLSTGVGETLFMLKFDQESHLEHFMREIGEKCLELRSCVILTNNSIDVARVQRFWMLEDETIDD
jgi:hypothetical protein